MISDKNNLSAKLKARETESWMNLALSAANVGLWSQDIGSHEIRVSEEMRLLFDFPAGVVITNQLFLDSIHSDDRERRANLLRQMIADGAN